MIQIFQQLGGYSLGQADMVRRAMSKKKVKDIEREREAFLHGDPSRNIAGCAAKGIPESVAQSGEQTGLEGCLSVPGKWGIVTRPDVVRVRAQDRYGDWFEVEGEGLTARAFCHEIEHLDGHLFVEHIDHFLSDEELRDYMEQEEREAREAAESREGE